MTEQFFENIRNLELGACGSPFVCMFTALIDDTLSIILGNVHGVVYQTDTVVSSLMLENITVLTAIFIDKIKNIVSDIRNLDGIRLDVRYDESPSLDFLLKCFHEQSATLGYNVVIVTRVAEWIAELRGRQSVHRVDDNFQRVSQVIPSIIGSTGHDSLCERNQFAIQQFFQSFDVLMLDVNTTILQILEVFRVLAEVLFGNQTGRVHRRNVIQTNVAVHAGLCVDIASFTDFLNDLFRLYFCFFCTFIFSFLQIKKVVQGLFLGPGPLSIVKIIDPVRLVPGPYIIREERHDAPTNRQFLSVNITAILRFALLVPHAEVVVVPVSLSQLLIFGIRNRLPQLAIIELPLRIFV